MGTRCGRLDAAVVLHLWQQLGMGADQISHLLYRESGLLGLSGESADMRALQASDSPAAAMAIDYLVEHLLRELAAMVAALRGIDVLVFTGGIGENAVALRERVVSGAAWMGLRLDGPANARANAQANARAGCVSATDSRAVIHVLHTNEEAVIARHTVQLLG